MRWGLLIKKKAFSDQSKGVRVDVGDFVSHTFLCRAYNGDRKFRTRMRDFRKNPSLKRG